MESLGLDIKLLIAQMVNFGLLFLVLSKVLYKPIINMLDERKKKIQESVENSKQIEAKLLAMEEEKIVVIRQAQEKGEKEKAEIIETAEKERRKIIDEAKVAAEREAKKGIDKVKLEEAEVTERVRQKVLKDLTVHLEKKFTPQNGRKGKYPLLDQVLKQ